MTHYTTLGLSPGASQGEIRCAYLTLATKHHPDRGGDPDYFANVTNAYNAIKDDDLRRQYDAELELTLAKCPTCNGQGRAWVPHGFRGGHYQPCDLCHGEGYARR